MGIGGRGVAAACLVAIAIAAAGCRGGLFRSYEYEEEMYLALDGTATVFVNSSIPALNALRGTSFDEDPRTPVDRDAVRAYFTTPVTRVTRVTVSRRDGRRHVHVRIAVDDVRRLAEAPPFSWSTYHLASDDELVRFRQVVAPGRARAPAELSVQAEPPAGARPTGWEGDELVAFRVHIPSEIVYHNAGPENPQRGNILVWEQSLAARLRGEPLELEARMEPRSILYTTLWLFGGTLLAAILTFAGVIWWLVRRRPASSRAHAA
jgi:hypothetical protein